MSLKQDIRATTLRGYVKNSSGICCMGIVLQEEMYALHLP